MIEDRESDNADNVKDPKENRDTDKVRVDSADNRVKVIDPPENQPPGTE